jgi:hypothetical protein
MRPHLEQLLRLHFDATADEAVREGQLDSITAVVGRRRQVPAWYAELRSPVPADTLSWDLRAERRPQRPQHVARLGPTLAVVVVATAVAWSALILVGSGPRPAATVPLPTASPSASPTPPPLGSACATPVTGALSAGCIEVAQGWTFNLGDHAAHLGPENDLFFEARDNADYYLSRPPDWASATVDLRLSSVGGRAGCLSAIGAPEPAGSVVPRIDEHGIAFTDLPPEATVCALSDGGHVFEVHLVQVRPPLSATAAMRVAVFHWIDWGPPE